MSYVTLEGEVKTTGAYGTWYMPEDLADAFSGRLANIVKDVYHEGRRRRSPRGRYNYEVTYRNPTGSDCLSRKPRGYAASGLPEPTWGT